MKTIFFWSVFCYIKKIDSYDTEFSKAGIIIITIFQKQTMQIICGTQYHLVNKWVEPGPWNGFLVSEVVLFLLNIPGPLLMIMIITAIVWKKMVLILIILNKEYEIYTHHIILKVE